MIDCTSYQLLVRLGLSTELALSNDIMMFHPEEFRKVGHSYSMFMKFVMYILNETTIPIPNIYQIS